MRYLNKTGEGSLECLLTLGKMCLQGIDCGFECGIMMKSIEVLAPLLDEACASTSALVARCAWRALAAPGIQCSLLGL